MAQNLPGFPWPKVPLAGAFIAGRHDEVPASPEGFSLTPSSQAAADALEEVPGEEPEQPG